MGGAGDDTPIYTEDYKFFWADPYKKMKKCSVNFFIVKVLKTVKFSKKKRAISF